jgi:hypothetical protein
VNQLNHVTDKISLPYKIVFVGGRKWETIGKKELVNLLNSLQ